MDNTSDEKICCDAYQVVEDGKSFWSMDDFYPKESKSCESVMPCPKEQSAQKSCSKKRPKKPMKHKKSCKRPSSAGTNLCTGNSSQQMAKQAPKNNSECSMKVSSCPPKVNKECVVILPPTERKSNCANFNQESAVEKSSNETVSCPICANMRNQTEQRGSQGSIGSRGSQGSQGSIGSQGGRGSQTLQRLSNASQQSGRRSSTGSFKDGSCHDSAVAKSSCGTVASRVCSCPQTKSSQNTACNNNDDQQISNSSCNDDQQISKPSCNDDQVAKQGNRQVAIKMCLEKPNDNMNCGDGSTTSYPCNIVMDFLKTGENGNQQPKRVKLSFQIYINGDKPQSAQLAIQSVDCCSCSN